MKKLLATLLALAALVTLPLTTLAASVTDFSDFPDGWSRDALTAAVDNGLLQGDNGKINPQGQLTRAQLAAILVRAFGITTKSDDLSSYTDVDPEAWYYGELSAAVAVGLFEGADNKLRPNDYVTREEVAIVLARAFLILDSDIDLSGIPDSSDISTWAEEAFAALVKAGYFEGYEDGSLRPVGLITREEFAQLMNKIVSLYITEPGEYTIDVDGNVVIRVSGVTLKDSKISGDVFLGHELDREDITLDNTTGGNLVILNNDTTLKDPVVPLKDTPDDPAPADTTNPADTTDTGTGVGGVGGGGGGGGGTGGGTGGGAGGGTGGGTGGGGTTQQSQINALIADARARATLGETKIDGFVQDAKNAWAILTSAEKAATNKQTIAQPFITLALAEEAACETDVNAIITQIRALSATQANQTQAEYDAATHAKRQALILEASGYGVSIP
jgi:hypothetical protein